MTKARIRSLIEIVPAGIFWANRQGEYVFVNEAWSTIAGQTPEKALGAGWTEALHPADRQWVISEWRRAGSAGEPFKAEYRFLRPGGDLVWVYGQAVPHRDGSGTITGYAGAVIDISGPESVENGLRPPRQFADSTAGSVPDISVALDSFEGAARPIEAYELLRKTVDRFELVVRGAHDGIWDWDIVEDRVYYSPRFKELLGYANHDECEDTLFFRNLLHPDDREKTIEAVYRHLKRRGPFDLEYRLRRKDGSYGWFCARGQAKWDQRGRPLRFAGAITDMTERRRAELDAKYASVRLQALSDRLLEIQEMERKHISQELHDEIGQALTAVKLHLQAAKRRPGDAPEQIEECLCLADGALQKVRELSLNLRPPQLDDLGLAAALRWYLDRQARAVGWIAHFEADASLARQNPNVETACFRVAQEALTNVARHAAASRVWVGLHWHGGELRLSVLDDGTGFAVDAARESAVKGGSMGLLGMEKRVAIASGRLEIISDPGKGTEVRAAFPADLAEPEE